MTAGYYSQVRPEVVELVPDDARRILDVGCGDGAVGSAVRGPGRTVMGIESAPEVAQRAATRLDAVHRVDLDDVASLRVTLEEVQPVDCVVAADVLEHLVDPWTTLAMLAAAVRPGGTVVLSVPNVRVISTIVPLVVFGRFEYADHGVRDRTHLRFFTRHSILELVESAGLQVVSVRRGPTPWRRGWRARVGALLGDLGNEQFLVVARCAP